MKRIISYSTFFLLAYCFAFPAGFAQTACSGGTAAGYACNNVDLVAHMPITSIGGSANTEGNDIWGWTDTLTGREFVIMGLTTGTAFVDISDPVNPVYLGFLATATNNSSWRDIKVYNNYAFIVSEAGSHGVQVFDLTQLRSVASPPVTFSSTARYTGVGRAHNIVGHEDAGYMVIVGSSCSGGLYFLDVSDPLNPSNDGCFSADGYSHDAVCFYYRGPDTEHFGKEICIGSNEDTQTIVDVTDKSNPIQLSRKGYTGSRYSHQAWVTDDHKYLIFDDELDESNNNHNTRTYIMDISDLDNPVFLGYHESALAAIDHNLYVKGQFAYQANYRGGLRILDLRNIGTANLSEVAYFDTYPSSNSTQFNGAWSVYPYFKSGIVAVSDIESGLFLVRPNLEHFVIEADRLPKTVCEAADITFNVDLTAYAGYTDMVNLSVSGLPAGAVATFGTNPVSPNTSTTLTISNTTGITGPYSLVIEGRGPSSNAVHDYSVSFNILPLPTLTNLAAPADMATAVTYTNTVFAWSAIANADTYTLEVSKDPSFGTVDIAATGISFTSYVASSLAQGTTYYWRVRGENSCGEGSNSSIFQFITDGLLPIDLLGFTAELENGSIALNWSTTEEVNNRGFEVLRWEEQGSPIVLTWIEGQGTIAELTSYSYRDRNVWKGNTYYYQLRQIDEDGEVSLSNIVSVKILGEESAYHLSPNPVKGNTTLNILATKEENLTISVFDIAGRLVEKYNVQSFEGRNTLYLDSEEWSAGLYLIKIENGIRARTLKLSKL